MKLAIMQPYIFPYIGYFQLIHSADKFLLLDDVAYINKGWINRNRLLINGEPQFFVMPVVGASQNKTINTLSLLQDDKWKIKLEKTIVMAYKKAIGFNDFFPVFKSILDFNEDHLAPYLVNSIQAICTYLDIKTTIIVSTSIYQNTVLKGQDRIIDLCKKENAKTYINASGGKDLYDSVRFRNSGITLQFIKAELNPYKQIASNDFVTGLSIIDLLMNCPKEFVKEQLNQYILD